MTDADTRSETTDGVTAVARRPAGLLDDVERQHRWLTVAWPLALIFHLLANVSAIPVAAVLQLVAAVVAVLVLLRPRLIYVGVLAAVFPVITYLKAPFVGNHELILAFSAWVVMASVISSRRRWPATALPLLRWVLIIAYGSIAISKLNRSFLDPSVSCAVQFADEFSTWIGFRASEVRSLSLAAIWATVVIELAIPVLLLVRRLRLIGVVVALCIHFALALEPASHVFDFTATLFPLFLAFAPVEIRERISDRIDDLAGGLGRSLLALGALTVMVASVVVVAATPAPPWAVPYPAWLLVGTTTLWWVLTGIRSRLRAGRGWDGDPVTGPRRPALLLPIVLLLVVNAVSPYLGLRTATAFNMYSNLETVEVDGDHLLFSGVDGVRSHELVRIVDAPDDHPLDYYVTEDRAVPADNLRWYQRERLASADSPGEASNADEEVVLEWLVSTSADPPTRLSDLDPGPGGWRSTLAHKFGFIRPVDLSSPARCLRSWGPAG